MSFLKYQKQSPEFLSNYLKYKRYIDFGAQTTTDETFFDLRTLFRYVKLYLYDKNKLVNITKEEFKKIDITDVTIEDLEKMLKDGTVNDVNTLMAMYKVKKYLGKSEE